jgi:hypothetical protein
MFDIVPFAAVRLSNLCKTIPDDLYQISTVSEINFIIAMIGNMET